MLSQRGRLRKRRKRRNGAAETICKVGASSKLSMLLRRAYLTGKSECFWFCKIAMKGFLTDFLKELAATMRVYVRSGLFGDAMFLAGAQHIGFNPTE